MGPDGNEKGKELRWEILMSANIRSSYLERITRELEREEFGEWRGRKEEERKGKLKAKEKKKTEIFWWLFLSFGSSLALVDAKRHQNLLPNF